MAGNMEDLIAVIHASAKDQASDEEADPKQLFYRLQIIFGDNFGRFVLRLERLINFIESAKSFCNPDYADDFQKVLYGWVKSYLYSIAGFSSLNGKLLNIVSQDTRKSTVEVLGRNSAKAAGILEQLGLGGDGSFKSEQS